MKDDAIWTALRLVSPRARGKSEADLTLGEWEVLLILREGRFSLPLSKDNEATLATLAKNFDAGKFDYV